MAFAQLRAEALSCALACNKLKLFNPCSWSVLTINAVLLPLPFLNMAHSPVVFGFIYVALSLRI